MSQVGNGLKLAGGIAGAVVLFVVLFVVVLPGGGQDEHCRPSSEVTGPEGVPSGELSKPMHTDDFVVTSEFRTPERPGHRGIDLGGDEGAALYSIAPGVVTEAGPASGFGNWIVIDHQIDGELISTVYGHMWADGLHVSAGDTVSAGQPIGEVGNAGQSTGPHLHFEMWEGGRTGGTEVDPLPWVTEAVDPGSESAGSDSGDAGGGEPSPDRVPREERDQDDEDGEESGELSPFDETNLQREAVMAGRAIQERFPDVYEIGGWRADGGGVDDHPSGQAVDAMIGDYQSSEGIELGNRVVNYFLEHAEHFNLDYMLWRQEYIAADGTRSGMSERSSDTENHFDHVHIKIHGTGDGADGGSLPPPPSGGADDTSGSTGSQSDDECEVGADGGRDLASDEIPEELVEWIELAASQCEHFDAPLLAGLMYHESAGFQQTAVSSAGAQGYAQAMPATWSEYGHEVDSDGEVVGPAGSGDPFDPADATMFAGRYLCMVGDSARDAMESGQASGDFQELMLAGYNAGPGAVTQHGGVPPYAETQNYVQVVPEEAQRFTDGDQLSAD